MADSLTQHAQAIPLRLSICMIEVMLYAAAPCTQFSLRPCQRYTSKLNDNILLLPRTNSLFQKMDDHPLITYDLCQKGALPGRVLKHVFGAIDKYRKAARPCIFKVGLTHDPVFRFTNDKFGYIHAKPPWDGMKVVFCSYESISTSYVEAAAIQRFMGHSFALRGSTPTNKT